MAETIQITSPGPQGSRGPTGPKGEPGFLTSYEDLVITGSLFVSGNLTDPGNITASTVSASGNIITNDITLSSDGLVNGSSGVIKLQGLGSSNNLQESVIGLDSYGGTGGQAITFNNFGGDEDGVKFIMHGTEGFFARRYYMVGDKTVVFQQNYRAANDNNGDTAFTFNNGYYQHTGYLFTVSHRGDPHFRIGNITGSIELLKPVTASGAISASGGFIGDLTGTASFATSASFADTSTTASHAVTASFLDIPSGQRGVVSASFATSASFADTSTSSSYAERSTTSSFAIKSGDGFPFVGSAQITGSLNTTGNISTLSGNISASEVSASFFRGNGQHLTGIGDLPFPFEGDAEVRGNITASNGGEIFAATGSFERIKIPTGTGTPKISSGNRLILSASDTVQIEDTLRLNPTTTQSVSTVDNGAIVYDSNVHKFVGYANGVWVHLH